MKRSISLIFLCSIFQLCAESTSFSSQFLKLLAPSEPVETPREKPIKKQKEKPAIKQEVIEADGLSPLLQLLVNKQETQKKLYKEDLESFNFEYVNCLKFHTDCEGFPKYKEKKLNKKEKANSKKYGELIAQGHEAPWYLKFINKQVGHGAFADADIEEDALVGEYTGIIIEVTKAKELDMSYAWTLISPEHYRDQAKAFFVDAKKAGNFTRFINHSTYANVKPLTVYSDGQWHMIYVAARDIKKDEQLLVDYGAGYWTIKSCKPVEMGL